MFNSFRNAIVITVVALLVCSIAGYGFEIYHDKGKDILMSILLLAMMLPFVAIMIPLFKMFSAWKLVNTWIALALPSISTPFLIMMFRQAARSFPHDIIEASRLEGLSEIKIFFTMFLPIMKSTYGAAMTVTFMNAWNNYLWPTIILQDNKSDYDADAGCQFKERIQRGLWNADAWSPDLYPSDRGHLFMSAEELCKRNCRSSEMRRAYALSEEEFCRAEAELELAVSLGLIGQAGFDALEQRRLQKNEENRRKKAAGEVFYGPCSFTRPMYLQYELTRFRLEFALPSKKVRDSGYCPEITEAQKRTFYQENQDLLTRAQGDLFSYEEIEAVIEKRLREAAYDRLVQDILCQSETRE